MTLASPFRRARLPLRALALLAAALFAGALLGIAAAAAPAAPTPPAAPAGTEETRVWASASSCRDVVEREHRRLAPDGSAARLRVAAWNIEWFPDHTDIGWLACTIAWLNLDLLGVSEIRDSDRARARMGELLAELARLTGAPWQVDLQRCGAKASQHVGFLWNGARLRLAAAEDAWALNARARGPEEPCAGWLRPGRHGYFLPAAGASAGFHALVVHLKSGARPADAAERAAALARLAAATAALGPGAERLILLGDFNTMGDGARGSAAAEVRGLLSLASAAAPALGEGAAPACSEYYRGRGGELDHVLASRAMGRVSAEGTGVSGYCAVARCAPISPWLVNARPAAYASLSDHCPVVVELEDGMLSRTRN
ncbi:MAG TPA: endonuclease/exonuclease/phosphatase family protein [Alphaproteobacteria bacterium]|nr:endonuclease/exonuclease/phosphatase family protein [Alphaproteobacteria bacterium]